MASLQHGTAALVQVSPGWAPQGIPRNLAAHVTWALEAAQWLSLGMDLSQQGANGAGLMALVPAEVDGHVSRWLRIRQPVRLAELPPELLQGLMDWLPTFASRARLRRLCSSVAKLNWRLAAPQGLEEELNGLGLGDVGAQAVCRALLAPHNEALTELCLGANAIGDAGAHALAAALVSPRLVLRRLSLQDNFISDKGALALADALAENSTLEELDLWGNLFGDHGKTAILSAARCSVFLEAAPRPSIYSCTAGTGIKAKTRSALFDWLVRVHTGMQVPAASMETPRDPQDVLFTTFSHIDAYVKDQAVPRRDLELISVACTWLAAGCASNVDADADVATWLSFVTDATDTAQDVRDSAQKVKDSLGGARHMPTSYTFLRRYLRRTGWTAESFSLAMYLIEIAALDAAFLEFRPQAIAAAAAILSRQYSSQGISVPQTPQWKKKLLQGAHVDLQHELAPCAAAMSCLHCAAQADLFVNRKYQAARLHRVAKVKPHLPCPAAYFVDYLTTHASL